MLHAHMEANDDDVTVHGGHFHEHEDEDSHSGPHVIDLQAAAAVSGVHHTPLLMMMSLAAVIWILCPLLVSVLLPVSAFVCSAPSKQSFWRPPLRGPPLPLV
jgi:hypothetical protein